MEAADHQFVPAVYGMYRGCPPGLGSTERHGIVMELMERGDLQSLLDTLPKPPPWPLAFRLAHQVALAMDFLHSKKELVHMDLKPANVLLDAKLDSKIADFGLSTLSHSVKKTSGKDTGGTVAYTPPEAFKKGYHRIRSYDVYSYGILLWSILTGEKPYPDKDRGLVEFRIQEGDRPDLQKMDVKKADGLEELVDLMKRCWDGEPTKRPKFKECIEVTRRVSSRHEEGIDVAVDEILMQVVPGYKSTSAKENEKRQDAVDSLNSGITDEEKSHFVIQHRARLIQSASTVMALVDKMGDMIHRVSYDQILAEKSPIHQLRMLYATVLDPGGVRIRAEFFNALRTCEPHLMVHLGESLSPQFKSNLRAKFEYMFEWIRSGEEMRLLNEAFTELCITEGEGGEGARPERPINLEDIFTPLPGEKKQKIRTVMMRGVAGIGKTVLAQKYALDWAEDKANKNIPLVFPFTVGDLNLKKGEMFSLVGLLRHHFGEIKEMEIYNFNRSQCVFIFDGLDEINFPLHFQNKEIWDDITKPTSVDILLTNLIKGNLLPSACILITTRPAAANQIPSEYVNRVTEVRGFTDPQMVTKYFGKRFSDKKQAKTTISHIQNSQSFHMCRIPAFCWITGLEHVLSTQKEGVLSKYQYLAEMYIRFMLALSKQKKSKYHDRVQVDSDDRVQADSVWNLENTQAILSLGKLAFEQLGEKEGKENEILEADLTECGIDVRDVVYSGVCTQIYKEERGLNKDPVFRFIDPSIQEFLAALYVFQHFIYTGINLLSEPQTPSMSSTLLTDKSNREAYVSPTPHCPDVTLVRHPRAFHVLSPALLAKAMSEKRVVGATRTQSNLHNLYQSAVDKTLQSPNRHLDMFLRFLLGFSLKTNQILWEELLNQTDSVCWSQTNQETVDYIRKKIKESVPRIKTYLLLCLKEMHV